MNLLTYFHILSYGSKLKFKNYTPLIIVPLFCTTVNILCATDRTPSLNLNKSKAICDIHIVKLIKRLQIGINLFSVKPGIKIVNYQLELVLRAVTVTEVLLNHNKYGYVH